MVDTPRKTFPELQALTAPVVDSDLLAVYRTPGPAKRTTAAIFSDYIKAFFSASGGSALMGFLQSGIGATARTVQAKLQDTVSVKDFGATGDGVTNDRAAIQAAIDALFAAGGGTLLFPNGKYVLGTTGLTTSNNIIFQGDSTRYAGSTTRGTSLVYTGTGNAIYGQNVLDVQLNDIDLDCTGTTGTSVRGINFSGVWKTTLRNVTIRGVTRAKGYGILFDTVGVSGPFGAQHNYLEQVECADGVIRFLGVDANDGVTTTVCNTIRGMQYQIVSSQIVFINSTAEGWTTGAGFDFSGAGCYGLMLGCDIEGAGTPGIAIDGSAEVREVGTIWAGFSGTNKVTGDTASLRSYGGKLEFLATLVADTPKLTGTAGNANLPSYVSDYVVGTNLSGGTQEGHRQWRRYVAGAEVVDHDWDQHSVVKKTIVVATTSLVTLMTVPIAGGDGFTIEVVARGFTPGDGWWCVTRRAVVINNGVVVITQQAQETAGIPVQISFDDSGNNVRVRFLNSTANSTNVYLTTRILGDYAGFS